MEIWPFSKDGFQKDSEALLRHSHGQLFSKAWRLTEVSFEGDFIGSIPASELAEKIKGLRMEDLCNIPAGDYFDGVDDISVLFR